MSKIYMTNAMIPESVILPGSFIKNYMAKASGEFVKIYLYLYYTVCAGEPLDLSQAADALLCTENDILRALKYWENQKALSLQYNKDGSVQRLTFLNLQEDTDTQLSAPPTRETTVSVLAKPADTQTQQVHSGRTDTSFTEESAPASSLSLEYDENFQELCFLAQTYTKKTLSSRDTQRLGYWYQLYNGSYQIIEYLLEYCVELGHTSFNYMEKVLLNWHESGYTTLAEIKGQGQAHNIITYRVMGAFGLKDRSPGSKEAEFIKKWYQTYGFSIEMIELACQKTLSAIQKPSFEYTDSILSAWKKKELTSPDQVTAFEQKRKQKDPAAAPARQAPARSAKKPGGSKFHNFDQHDTDYSQLLSEYYGVKLP